MSLSLRAWVALEIGVLALATALFLALFPQRSIRVDLPLALLAGGLIALDARRTRDVIWGSREETSEGARDGGPSILALTLAGIALLFLFGAAAGYRSGGWSAAASRVFQRQLPLAFVLYLAWALLQQTLFQFYLLGRLVRLLPAVPPLALCALNGLAFSSVHWPDGVLMSLTAVAGSVWSYSYFKNRRLWPIALSHAALGAAFYYWVCARPLGAAWIASLTGG